MRRDLRDDPRLSQLPKEPIDRLTKPLMRFLRIETASGAVLLLAATAALILSNAPWADVFLAVWETREEGSQHD